MPFDRAKADHALSFFYYVLKYSTDEWYGKPFELTPWQYDAVEHIFGNVDDEGRRTTQTAYIEVVKKPLALSTAIPTPAGWTTMGELKIGDEVFNEEGKPCKVVGLSPIYRNRDCYKVVFSDGECIVADAQHEWQTQTKKPHRVVAKHSTEEIARTLMFGRMRNHSMPLAGPLDLPEADLPLDPWMLGYWLGNGTRNHNVITCSKEDSTYVVSRIYAAGHSAKCERRQTDNTVVVQVDYGTGKKCSPCLLVAALRECGVWQKKFIPPSYLRSSIRQRRELLAGLLDSDGDCSKAGGACRFNTSSKLLCDGAYELICSLGYQARVTSTHAKYNGKDYGLTYRIYFTAYRDDPVFSLTRKSSRQRVRKHKVSRSERRYIASVTKTKSVPVRCITVDSNSHLFLAGRGMIPTCNSGKTEWAAGLALYILAFNEFPGCQIYGVAAATRQALNVYRAACKMIEQSVDLTEMFRILRSTNRILKRDDPDTFYSAVAADGDLGDGVNPACVIADEVHRYSTRKQMENWDVLSNGGITRRQSLTIAITTAGVRNKSPIAWKLHEKSKKLQEGIITDDKFYGRVYGADPDDDPGDEKTWIKANPSLKVNGGFLELEKIRDKYNEHKTAGTLTTFRRYFLNMWDQDERKAIDMRDWDACPLDWHAKGLLAKQPGDIVRPISGDLLKQFMDPVTLSGRRCWVGIDLSMTTDLSAVSFVFPREYGLDGYDILPFFYLPSKGLKEAEVRDGMPYTQWVEEGFLEVSDIVESAGVVDYGELQKRLMWGARMFDVQGMCFDPWNSRQISASLLAEGYPVVEVPQQYATLSEASKKFLALVVSRKIHHGDHPVLRWNASCLTYKECNDNIRFIKPERLKTSSRIDGISATTNAIVSAIAELPVGQQTIEVW